MNAPPHTDETHRLAALARLDILDTPPEERFDRITRLAARLLDVPVALVNLIDERRQWTKAAFGTAPVEIPRELSFCTHAVDADDALVVTDAVADERFCEHPFVVGEPWVRSYAGQVVHDRDGHPVGTLCVVDQQPRSFDGDDLALLADLAAMVESELARTDAVRLLARLEDDERTTSSLLDALDEGLVMTRDDGRIVQWNRRAE